MIKVLIVDDHHLFAEGVKSMFKPEDGIKIVNHTANGNAVPYLLDSEEIDVILMDIDMPVMDGIATLELLNSRKYKTPVLMLTMHQSLKQVKSALEKGAQGYILKDASKAELVQAITDTSNFKNYFHSRISDQIFNYFRGKNNPKTDIQELSGREKEIVKCVADGLNTRAIAALLFISEHTVKTHRKNIMHKLNVKTSAELIKLALDKNLI